MWVLDHANLGLVLTWGSREPKYSDSVWPLLTTRSGRVKHTYPSTDCSSCRSKSAQMVPWPCELALLLARSDRSAIFTT